MKITSKECMVSVLDDLAECLLYPFVAIPEECVSFEDVAELLLRRVEPA